MGKRGSAESNGQFSQYGVEKNSRWKGGASNKKQHVLLF